MGEACAECNACGNCACCLSCCCCGTSLGPSIAVRTSDTVGCGDCRGQRRKWEESGDWKLFAKKSAGGDQKAMSKAPRVYVGQPRLIQKAELQKIEEEHVKNMAKEAAAREVSAKEAAAKASLEVKSMPQVKAQSMLPLPKRSFEVKDPVPEDDDQQAMPRFNRAARRHRAAVNRVAQGVVTIPEEGEKSPRKEESKEAASGSGSSSKTATNRPQLATASQDTKSNTAGSSNGQAGTSPDIHTKLAGLTFALDVLRDLERDGGVFLSQQTRERLRMTDPSGRYGNQENIRPPRQATGRVRRPLPQLPVQQSVETGFRVASAVRGSSSSSVSGRGQMEQLLVTKKRVESKDAIASDAMDIDEAEEKPGKK